MPRACSCHGFDPSRHALCSERCAYSSARRYGAALALAVAAGVGLVPVPARADAADVTALDGVIVTATRTERTLAEVPVSASVVSAQEVSDISAQSLDDVLRHVAGMNLPIQNGNQAHPTADNLSMRGLGGIHALMLVDGVPVNDPFFGYVQWGRIPLEDIDRIEIVRGGGSPLWGNFAMGGTVNVITRAPTADTTSVDAGAGNFGTYRGNFYGSYGTGTANRVTVDAAANGTSGFQAVPDDARRSFDTPTSFHAQNLRLRDRFDPAPGWTVDLSATYHENRQQLGQVLNLNRQHEWDVVANLRYAPTRGAALTASVFHTDSRFLTSNPTVNDSTLPPAQQTEHTDNVHTTPYHALGGSLAWSQDGAGWLRNGMVGLDANHITGYDSAAIFDATGVNRVRTDVGSGEEDFAGAFAQVSIVPHAGTEILVSAREQRFTVRNGYDGNPGGAGAEPDRTYDSFDPRLSLRQELVEHVALRAAAYRAFRAPTLDNLFRGFASNGGIYYPNSNLKPETLHGGEVGLDYVAQDLRAQITLYRTFLSSLITTANLSFSQLPAGFFYGGRLVNAASALAQGLEVETQWRVTSGWQARLAYTLATSLTTGNPNDPGSVGKQLTDVPREVLSLQTSYQGAAGWRVASDARWVSATSWANSDHSNPGFPYQASADPHFVVDLSGQYPVGRHVELFAQVQNLLNRRYIVNPGPYNPPDYGTPFSVYAGVRCFTD